MTALALGLTDVDGTTVAHPSGLLDLSTYRSLRDGLLRCAAEEPIAVIVRLDDGFVCATPEFMSVFGRVRSRLSEWPGLPLVLVVESAGHRWTLSRGRGSTLVPRFTALASALDAVRAPPERRRGEIQLPDTLLSALPARRFVRDLCERWHVEHLVDNALIVTTELVENAVRHASSAPVLRVALRADRLTIAVRDESTEPPVAETPGGHGLTMIATLSRTWGVAPWPRGGKVVWAVLD